jgi:hypothetical protein
MHHPYGYDKDGNEVEEQLDALFQAIQYALDGMSGREAATWLSGNGGRSISHEGFRKRMAKEIRDINNTNGIREK